MITGMEIAACQHMAVPAEVMQHVVNVESGYNPYAIGVVGGQLVRQPQNLGEAVATAQMLDAKGYNFSVGLAQVNRANFSKYGLTTYQQAFDVCPNLVAGARILSECYASSGNDWGKSFSCYYSGNFVTGYRDGYVQKIFASMNDAVRAENSDNAFPTAIPVVATQSPSLSALRSTASNIAVNADVNSARYRLAIRSSAIDAAATIATQSVANRVLPKTSADSPSSADAADMAANAASPAAASPIPQPPPTVASADVFEPQVRKIGDPPAAALPQAASDPATASPAAPPTEQANQQGSNDSAFVF